LKTSKGFTLVEAMVVVAILAILAAVTAPSFKSTLDATRARKAADHIAQVVALTQSQALNRNVDTYLSVNAATPPTLCVSTTASTTSGHTCDVLSASSTSNTTIALSKVTAGASATQIIFSGITGRPDSISTLVISANSARKTVLINALGIVSIAS
jgi:prepilin-type N-terminal cleavage/methylation domain-containing protein